MRQCAVCSYARVKWNTRALKITGVQPVCIREKSQVPAYARGSCFCDVHESPAPVDTIWREGRVCKRKEWEGCVGEENTSAIRGPCLLLTLDVYKSARSLNDSACPPSARVARDVHAPPSVALKDGVISANAEHTHAATTTSNPTPIIHSVERRLETQTTTLCSPCDPSTLHPSCLRHSATHVCGTLAALERSTCDECDLGKFSGK